MYDIFTGSVNKPNQTLPGKHLKPQLRFRFQPENKSVLLGKRT